MENNSNKPVSGAQIPAENAGISGSNERMTVKYDGNWALKLDNPESEAEAREMLIEKYKKAVIKLAVYEDINPDPTALLTHTIKETQA